MTSHTDVPASLKPIAHFVKIANEYAERDPVIYYWCMFKAVEDGMRLDKGSPQARDYLMRMLDVLEKIKVQNGDNDAIKQAVVAQAYIEDHAQKLLNYAESQDSQGIFNVKVVKAFYTAAYLYEVLTNFGELDDAIQLQSAKKYAKWRATYINQCTKTGETPTPGNQSQGHELQEYGQPTPPNLSNVNMPTPTLMPRGDSASPYQPSPSPRQQQPGAPYNSSGGIGFGSGGGTGMAQPGDQFTTVFPPNPNYWAGPMGGGQGSQALSQPPQPRPPPPTQAPIQPPTAAHSAPATGPYQQHQPSTNINSNGLKLEAFIAAKKHVKYAMSALDYEDAKTGVAEMRKAIAILEHQGEGGFVMVDK